MATIKKKQISKKRQKLGRQLAATLPRDRKGKFLPKGSKNLFRKKPAAKRRRTSAKTKKKGNKRRTSGLSKRPMAKRRRIAGGARRVDEFANFIVSTLRLDAAVANLAGTTRVQTPLPRIKTSGKRATVLEILWCEILIPTLALNFDRNSSTTILVVQLAIGSPGALLTFSDPRVFAEWEFDANFLPSVNGNTRILFGKQPFRYELQTRGSGSGYLLTAEAFNFNAALSGQNPGFPLEVALKVWYRFVEIPLDEFVGLVQSTQQQ